MSSEMTTDQTANAGVMLAETVGEVSVLKLYGVATAFYERVMTYDPKARGGKGSFRGGVDVVRIMADGAAEAGLTDFPSEYAGQVSKIARVMVEMARDLLDIATADIRLRACRDWVKSHGDPCHVYNEMKEKDSSGSTLTQMVANLLAWAEKNGVPSEDVVAEVVNQVEG